MCKTLVGADEIGVWCERQPGDRTHIPWADITSVWASNYDCKTHIETILEFNHLSGHALECNDTAEGYDSLIAAVGRHFALPAEWYSDVANASVADDSLRIWEA